MSGVHMQPLGILYLYRIRLRARLAQEAFAALGIAAGVALLFASQVASTSLTGSVRQLTSGVVGQSQLQLQARGAQGFPEGLLGQVAHLPGVSSAAPILQTQANLIGPAGQRAVFLIGADPGFVRLGGPLLQHFSAAALARQHAVALPAPTAAAVGVGNLGVATLQTGASSREVLVGLTLQASNIGSLVYSPLVLAPLAYAQQLAGMQGQITRIFVRPAPGRDAEVRSELEKLAAGRLNVEPADFDATLFENAAAPTNESTDLFAAISALVGFLFAFNAMLLTVPARRRLISDLQLDGYSPLTVIEVLVLDALALGLVASLIGLALGDELSIHLSHTDPGFLSLAFAVGSQRIVTWQSAAIAVAAGMLAAGIGVLAPMRDILSPRPLAAVERKHHVRHAHANVPVLPLAGLACLFVTTIILVAAPGAATIGIVSLTAALMLLLPGFLRGVLHVVQRATFDLKAMAPFVAVSELQSPSTWARTVAIASTGAIAVFGSVSVSGAHSDLQRGLDRSAHDVTSPADVWAFPHGRSNLLATTPFRPTAAHTLARLPGVRAVLLYRASFLNVGDRRVWVSAQPAAQTSIIPTHQLVDGSLALAGARLRAGGWAVISQGIADERHLHIGQAFTLPSPHPLRFRVAALSTNIGWPSGAILLNAEDYARAWESEDASAYEIMLAPGASIEAVRRQAQRALGPDTGLTVQTAFQRERDQRAVSRQGLARLTQISTLLLIAAILAMAAAMGNLIWQRRARLARLKLDGHTDLQVWCALILESVLLLGSGCSLGAVFGLYGQLIGSRAILSTTGFPVIFSAAALTALVSFALVAIVAVAIAAVPGYFVSRVRPVLGFSD
jgi:putative ABC transport system permease protein